MYVMKTPNVASAERRDHIKTAWLLKNMKQCFRPLFLHYEG